MNNEEYKKYSVQARTAIKGEAFFESLIADYAIPHHVVGLKDVGIDYICEWVHGDRPSGVLFAAQIKTFTASNRTVPEHIGTEVKFNGLEKYRISNSNLLLDNKTLAYCRGLGLPIYLFVIVRTTPPGSEEDQLNCYYKRLTYVLTRQGNQEDEGYYKVNRGAHFVAFADDDRCIQGFARDLFIDLMRWSYYKGNIAWLNPRRLGLLQFPEEQAVFQDLFEAYKERICLTYSKAKHLLDRHCSDAIAE